MKIHYRSQRYFSSFFTFTCFFLLSTHGLVCQATITIESTAVADVEDNSNSNFPFALIDVDQDRGAGSANVSASAGAGNATASVSVALAELLRVVHPPAMTLPLLFPWRVSVFLKTTLWTILRRACGLPRATAFLDLLGECEETGAALL